MSSAEDSIHDDTSDSEPVRKHAHESQSTLPFRKRSRRQENGSVLFASQKFRKGSDGSKALVTTLDPRPWTEKYGPTNIEELAVHKKKWSDVQGWLENVLKGRIYQRLLILKGAPGSAKTTTVNLLSRALGCETIEWRNPTTSSFESSSYVSVLSQFEDFVHRSRKYGSLDLVQTQATVEESFASSSPQSSTSKTRQVSIVEEFPNTFTGSSAVLQSLRSTVLQYLAANTPAQRNASLNTNISTPTNPLVVIISESFVSDSVATADSYTAYRLLGPEILNHPGTSIIEFNPTAPTIISKALNLCLQKHARATGQRYSPTLRVMQKLAEIGDIRNAVSTLEFLCCKPRNQSTAEKIVLPSKSSKARSKAKKKPSSVPSDAVDSEVLLISHRESMLSLFHAVGKVVHNKRIESRLSSDSPESNLPPHLIGCSRPHPPENDPSTLLSTAGTDASTFLAAVHENYLFSCYPQSGDTEATLAHVDDCLNALCISDILECTNHRNNTQTAWGRARGWLSEGLRQEELAFTTGVCGMWFSLPSPVKRQIHPGQASSRMKGIGDAHRIYYPTSLKTLKRREEIESLTNLIIASHYDGSLHMGKTEAPPSPNNSQVRRMSAEKPNLKSSSLKYQAKDQNLSQPSSKARAPPFTAAKGGMVWRRPARLDPNYDGSSATLSTAKAPDEEDSSHAIVSLGSGHSARQELLLERLPYIAMILRSHTGSSQATSFGPVSNVEQITKFSTDGFLRRQGAEDEDDGDEVSGESRRYIPTLWKGDKDVGPLAPQNLNVQKLVLSDDDIEDD